MSDGELGTLIVAHVIRCDIAHRCRSICLSLFALCTVHVAVSMKICRLPLSLRQFYSHFFALHVYFDATKWPQCVCKTA
jgi:hypothetical protein